MLRISDLKFALPAVVALVTLPAFAADAPPASAVVAWREVRTAFAAEATG